MALYSCHRTITANLFCLIMLSSSNEMEVVDTTNTKDVGKGFFLQSFQILKSTHEPSIKQKLK